MGRHLKDTNLGTRTARARLKVRSKPYWRAVTEGHHIGYRKGRRGGRWVARKLVNGDYTTKTLGIADDHLDADGVTIFDFRQAQDQAADWFAKAAGGDVKTGPYKVRHALADYLDAKEASKGHADAKRIADVHILPELGEVEVDALTAERIRKWHGKLAATPPRRRTAKGKQQQYAEVSDDPEERRRRRSTANRILTVLKAALNHAFTEGKVQSNNAWRRVKPYENVERARADYLTLEQCIRLVNAAEPRFRPLVQAALYSGCRYGELTQLRAHDYHADSGTLTVRESKSGKPRHVVLTEEAQKFFATHCANLADDAVMFAHEGGVAWGKSHQIRPMKAACSAAKIAPVGFHVLRHTYASHLAMAGVPLFVLAKNLGHTDTRMVERHYGHLAPNYVAEVIRQHAPALRLDAGSNVEVLKQA